MEDILNQIPLPLYVIDEERRLRWVNQAALSLFGREKSELLGKPCHNLQTGICGTPDCAIEQMKAGKQDSYFQWRDRHYKVTTSIIEGEEIKYVEILQDVTTLVQMQKALEEKTLELETVSETLAGGILITSLEEGFPVLQCNHGYEELIGLQERDLVGKPALRFVLEDHDQIRLEIQSQLDERREVFLEHQLVQKDGSKIWVSLRGHSTRLYGEEVGIWLLCDISQAKESERRLKINEERYRVAIENTKDVIIDYDFETRRMYHSDKAMDIYGVPELVEGAPESLMESGVVQRESEAGFLDLFRRMQNGEPRASCDLLARAADGCLIWNRLSMSTIFDNEGKPARAVGILQDIDREKAALRKYELEMRYKELTVKDAALYYEINLTQQRFMLGHDRLLSTYGAQPTNDYNTIEKLILDHMIFRDDRAIVAGSMDRDSLMQAYAAGKQKVVLEYRRNTGEIEPTWVECTIYLVEEDYTKDICGIVYIKDIDQEKRQMLSFRQKAERDLLTGLYNKVTTENRIKQFITSAGSMPVKKVQGAFLLIDLDDFKHINDTMGHAFGDVVLSRVADSLRIMFRETDVVGRVGGDEFTVFLSYPGSPENVMEKAAGIGAALRQVDLLDHSYKISCSIGVALFPQDGNTFQMLYENADKALYFSKRKGKDTFSRYKSSMADEF